MFAARRSAGRQLQLLARQQARKIHDDIPHPYPREAKKAASGHHEVKGVEYDAHSTPKDESLGLAFALFVAVIPAGIAVSYFAGDRADGSWSRLKQYIESKRAEYLDDWTAKNNARTQLIEQAAKDRLLMTTAPRAQGFDLKFPEIFNTGSPWNVPAGRGRANMDFLIAHYEKKREEDQAKKLQALGL